VPAGGADVGRAGQLAPRAAREAVENGDPVTWTIGELPGRHVGSVRSAEDEPDYRIAAFDSYLAPRVHGRGAGTDAVRTLLGWYQAGLDVEALLPRLATYLGHREPRFTYTYRSIVVGGAATSATFRCAVDNAVRSIMLNGVAVDGRSFAFPWVMMRSSRSPDATFAGYATL